MVKLYINLGLNEFGSFLEYGSIGRVHFNLNQVINLAIDRYTFETRVYHHDQKSGKLN